MFGLIDDKQKLISKLISVLQFRVLSFKTLRFRVNKSQKLFLAEKRLKRFKTIITPKILNLGEKEEKFLILSSKTRLESLTFFKRTKFNIFGVI